MIGTLRKSQFDFWCVSASLLAIVALALPLAAGDGASSWSASSGLTAAVLGFAGVALLLSRQIGKNDVVTIALVLLVVLGATVALALVHREGVAGHTGTGFWLFVIGVWAVAWKALDALAELDSLVAARRRLLNVLVPAGFGLWLLFLWESVTIGFGIPGVLLPSPSAIAVKFGGSLDILWADFTQTFLKAVIAGYVIGCGSGFLVSILVDRVPFLQRGLLPYGNLVSALPIVGIAPIMVMWFGFDWQSKAAVVVVMTFFPMLVNTVAGLSAAGMQERDLMRSYAAGYWSTLFKLRLPAALPFIFNALKINSTLALIGAIVAEFFGTPIVGMGFRISTEVGRMNVDMVWAEIFVAALAGSAFYGAIALVERSLTFWHPSYRQRK